MTTRQAPAGDAPAGVFAAVCFHCQLNFDKSLLRVKRMAQLSPLGAMKLAVALDKLVVEISYRLSCQFHVTSFPSA